MWLRDALLARFPLIARLPPHAYAVGGAVRDLLLGRDPADIDITCDDPLAAARLLQRKVIRLGREELSAWRVVLGPHVYDFAQILGGDIVRDLARRDFTINAMAVDLASGELLDPHGGRRDIEARLVRMVDAKNFDDDPLRMLKAVRMAVKLDFAVDEATIAAIRPRAAAIVTVPVERVSYELSLIFSAGRFRRAIELLGSTALDVVLFGRHLSAPVPRDDVSPAAALALLVDDPHNYAERWRWSDALLRDVLTLRRLARDHSLIALYEAGESVARQLPPMLNEEVAMPDFNTRALLTGDEIASRTGASGPEIGRLKRKLLDAQLCGNVRTREEAAALVSQHAARSTQD